MRIMYIMLLEDMIKEYADESKENYDEEKYLFVKEIYELLTLIKQDNRTDVVQSKIESMMSILL
jgi:hypothetical protein